jgi:serine/threonine/tyrosine-interacting protein
MPPFEENCLSDHSIGHTRVVDYSYRVPTPPRIVIPPPSIHVEYTGFGISQIAPSSDRELDLSFLEKIDYASIARGMSALQWTYELRRQAQAILPFLYLGPMSAAKDKDFLQREAITMLLAVRPRTMNQTSAAFRVAEELGLPIDTVDVVSPQVLIAALPRAVHIIQQHLCHVHAATGGQRLGKVLIFCESGNDRSATVAAAYLMETFANVDYIKAMQIVQSQRFCANFDDMSKQLLRSYWEILQARRTVAQAQQTQMLQVANNQNATNSGMRGKHKRSVDDFHKDMDVDYSSEGGDDARFEGRKFVPFKDGL